MYLNFEFFFVVVVNVLSKLFFWEFLWLIRWVLVNIEKWLCMSNIMNVLWYFFWDDKKLRFICSDFLWWLEDYFWNNLKEFLEFVKVSCLFILEYFIFYIVYVDFDYCVVKVGFFSRFVVRCFMYVEDLWKGYIMYLFF